MGLHQIMNNVQYVTHIQVLNISKKEGNTAQPLKKTPTFKISEVLLLCSKSLPQDLTPFQMKSNAHPIFLFFSNQFQYYPPIYHVLVSSVLISGFSTSTLFISANLRATRSIGPQYLI